MFDTRVRRHPVQTFEFWFVVLTSFVVVTVWKLDLFSFAQPVPVLQLDEEPMPPPPGGGNAALLATDEAAPHQSVEMEADVGPIMSPIARQLADPIQVAAALDNPAVVGSGPPSVLRHSPVPVESENPIATASAQMIVPEKPHLESVPAAAPRQEKKPAENQAGKVASANEEIHLEEVDRLVRRGEEVAAQRMMSEWYWRRPETRPQLMDRLNVLARRIYFRPEIHYTDPYVVRFGDTLGKIASQYQVTPEYLMRLNRLSSEALTTAQNLKVIQGPFGAIVNIGNQQMTVHAQGYFVASFPVQFDPASPLPQGVLHVTRKHSGIARNLASPANSTMGVRVLELNNEQETLSGCTIYGANIPREDGRMAGRKGGLQLGIREADAVYDLLIIGSQVIIQP